MEYYGNENLVIQKSCKKRSKCKVVSCVKTFLEMQTLQLGLVKILLVGNQTNFQDFPFTPAYLACRNLEDLSTAQAILNLSTPKIDYES